MNFRIHSCNAIHEPIFQRACVSRRLRLELPEVETRARCSQDKKVSCDCTSPQQNRMPRMITHGAAPLDRGVQTSSHASTLQTGLSTCSRVSETLLLIKILRPAPQRTVAFALRSDCSRSSLLVTSPQENMVMTWIRADAAAAFIATAAAFSAPPGQSKFAAFSVLAPQQPSG